VVLIVLQSEVGGDALGAPHPRRHDATFRQIWSDQLDSVTWTSIDIDSVPPAP
jgi:hypothetical protein